MNPMTRLTTALALSGISGTIAFGQTSITPEVLLYDGFESGTLAAWPFTTASASTNGIASVAPVVVNSGGSDPVLKGTKSVKHIARDSTLPVSDPLRLPRISYAANLSREQTNDETILFTYHYYDQYGISGVATSGLDSIFNQRFWMALRDSDGVNPFNTINQIAALGTFNAANSSFGTGFVGNNWFGAAPAGQSLGNHYAGRIFSVIAGNGLVTVPASSAATTSPAVGNSAPSWMFFGMGPNFRRASGWRKMSIAYNVRRSEFFVDSAEYGAWDMNPLALPTQRRIDSVILNPSVETPAQHVWVDEVSVRAFPVGSLNLLPALGDIVNPSAVSTVPLSFSLTPTGGNTNSAVSTITISANADGEVNLQMPVDVRGTYQLELDGGSWLKRKANIVIKDHGTFEFKVNLQNGDVDQSGEVDAADIDLVIANFGATGVPSTSGDVDLSDEIDAADIDIVIANFGGIDD